MPNSSVSKSTPWKLINFLVIWFCLFGIAILIRLPHFLSDNFFFDGDEAIVGIMSKDLLSGNSFPIYFYGQNYGLSIIEILSVSIFIKLLGSGLWALKLGALLVYTFGLTFIWKSFKNLSQSSLSPYLIIALLMLFPIWYMWGTLARGGYVTAFMIICVIFYITQTLKPTMRNVIITGSLTCLAFEAQLLIFMPIIPLLAFWIFESKNKWYSLLFFGLGFTLLMVLLRFSMINATVWDKPNLIFSLDNFLMQSSGFFSAYSSHFLYTVCFDIPIWLRYVLLFSIVCIVVLIVLIFKSLAGRKRLVFLCVLFCLLIEVGFMFFFSSFAPRYWIGFFSGLLFLILYGSLYVEFSKLKTGITISLILSYAIAIVNASELKREWNHANENEVKLFNRLYIEAKKSGIKGVYTTEPDVQWKWNYLYGDQIPATFFSENERTNKYKNEIEKLETLESYPIGMIGYKGMYNGLGLYDVFMDNRIYVGSKYYLIKKVNAEIIEEGKRLMR